MKRMRGRPRGAVRFAVVLGAALVVAAPVDGQDRREDCRCIDRDGNEIENCTCFRAPRLEGLRGTVWTGPERPRLGVSVDAMQSARHDAEGALVTGVLEGGPAEEAGIREGDVITGIDGRSLAESIGARGERDFDLDQSMPVQRLLAIVRELEPGQEVEVTYLRGDEARTTTLEAEDLGDRWLGDAGVAIPRWNDEGFADRLRDQLRALSEGGRAWSFRSEDWDEEGRRGGILRYQGPRADVRVLAPEGDARGFVLGGGSSYRDGLDLVELNPGLGAYFGAEEGVLVTDVARSSGLGLQPGDVVLRVGDRFVATPERLRRILSSYGDEEEITFHVLREGEETTVTGQRRY